MALIPDAFIQDLLARVDVADVVGRYVPLRKAGINLLGLCPFHKEKSPSFTVSPSKQFYHCFGCGAHGSAIRFLMDYGGLSFPEAVRQLAQEVGMTVPQAREDPQERQQRAERRAQRSAAHERMERINAHYRQCLRGHLPAIDYLKKRGLTGQIAARYQLGYAEGGRSALRQVLADYDDPAWVELGMVIEDESGRRDRFRDRIMFPIRNGRGELVGFGGRVLGQGEPKYLNSPETPLFSKGQELYGLWEARQAIREARQVVVVEGYMDVLALAQWGIGFAVATLGTATTPHHVKRLLRETDRIVFAFDGDSAGRRAAGRALQACLPMLRDDLSIRFLFLPTEHDPDSYVRELGPEAFLKELERAQPLSRFLLDDAAEGKDLETAEGRAELVHAARPSLQAIPPIGLRLQLVRELAQRARLTVDEIEPLLALPDRPQPEPGNQSEVGMVSDVPFAPGMPRAARPPLRYAGTAARSRQVVPLAQRLIRLLLQEPAAIGRFASESRPLLERLPELEPVASLLGLIEQSQAVHAGGVMAAAEGHEHEALYQRVLADDLTAEAPSEPLQAWKDAMKRVELRVIEAELSELAQRALSDPAAREPYARLMRRMSELKR